MPLQLNKEIRYVKGVGEKREKLFNKLNIYTLEDLLLYFPKKYLDLGSLKKISELQIDKYESFLGEVTEYIEEKKINKLTIIKIYVKDETGIIETVWFNQSYIKNILKPKEIFSFSGKIEKGYRFLQIKNPEFEKYDNTLIHTARIVPIYGLCENLSQKVIRNIIYNILEQNQLKFEDNIPIVIREKYNLSEVNFALKNIHFPDNNNSLEIAKKRFKFEEFYFFQLALLFLKKDIEQIEAISINNVSENFEKFKKLLTFNLTNAQERAIKEILDDLQSTKQMNRLIQGDVGCGKTVVAFAAAFVTIKDKFQVALMAPTEVLAYQHYLEAQKLFNDNIKICFLSGSTSKKQKVILLEKISNGEIDLVIGTHAIIQESINFKNLGLVITDEQHRFGVRQRIELTKKGNSPNILVMTATPIPRTLSLVMYGDLDISVIDELPPGRKKILTYAVDETFRKRINNFIKKQILEGRQVYWICPLIEESENLDAKSAIEFSKKLKEGEFKEFNIKCLHGRLSAKDRDKILQEFRDGLINILVSTTVVEVGVNVPNATVIVIENAERFGLAQLHQLRGRVGRGDFQSYCILINNSSSEISRKRMKIMQQSTNGFEVAEMDLKIRGPGDFFGDKQHGIMNFKIVNIFEDIDILKLARQAAIDTIRLELLDEKIITLIKKKYIEKLDNIGL
ncbi:ATP-dependent DNA helicase RecG [Caldicellulosiruptoraceae bacterium PP1]